MHRIVNYNENKVKEGVAACLAAENYPLNPEELTFKMKLNFLLKRMQLNENVKRNSVHISLNFDPSESQLTREKLTAIAYDYMQKLGFGGQPYLVYQHHDAAHPHIHIVTTNIQADGSRIDLHHLAIRKSEPARLEIEKKFGLVVASERSRRQLFRLKPIPATKVHYGRSATKAAISNVLTEVVENYLYASLPELNAVLGLYNVKAERGRENSRIYQSGGLVYRVTDEQGNPVGVPIKASDFYNKPTLQYLQTKFTANRHYREKYKVKLQNTLDKVMAITGPSTLEKFIIGLEKRGISAVLRRNEAGLLYGITYIDHTTKCVFNGSALGKVYSAKSLQERYPVEENKISSPHRAEQLSNLSLDSSSKRVWDDFPRPSDFLDTSTLPEQVPDYLPYPLRRNKRKKKKRL